MLSGTFVPGVTFCMSQTKRKKNQLPFTNRQGALILLGLATLLIILLAMTLHWS
jgi:hypothetical protein